MSAPFPMLTLPEIIGPDGLLTDGDWVESKDQDPAGTVRLTQLADVGDGEFRDRSDRWMNDEQASRLRVTMLKQGDVLIARMPDPLGRACVCPALPTRAVTVVDVCIVRAPGHNPKWLMHAINAPQTRSKIAMFQAGSTRKRISKGNLSVIPIPVPERAQQDRLVAAVEMHFSRLDAAVESLTRVKGNFKRARACVLQAGVEGRLVPTDAALAGAERRGCEPASVRLGRILAERTRAWAATGARGKCPEPFAPETSALPDLPEGWCWTSMDALLHGIEAGKSFAADSTPPSAGQVGIVKVSAVTWGTYQEDESKTVHDPGLINPAYFIKRGDLLLSRANTIELVGAVVIADQVTRDTMLSDKILRLNMPVELRRWVMWVLRSRHGRRQIEALATGNQESMRNIGQERIRQIAVPLPPSSEQQRIVAEVDRRFSVLDALEASVDANLARCARLRQGILKQAFEGRLVRPNPVAS